MTLWNAKSVDPTKVTPADVAAILAEHNIDTDRPVREDFFQPGVTYRRNDEFQCLAVGWFAAGPAALGLLPVNLGGVRTWEFDYMYLSDWQRGWTKVEAETIYAWCFDHGTLHTFGADAIPWCTAAWVPFAAASKESALEAKTAAYGDAVFFDQLTSDRQLEVVEICESWTR